MQTRLISIIIGAVLIVSMGSLVYKTKKPVILPSEEGTTSESLLNDNSKPAGTVTPAKPSTQPSVKKYVSDDDDNESDDDDRGSTTSPVVTPKPPTTTTPPATTTGGITLATIAKHNSRSSCWSAINGSVYDLTSWVPNHPGGEQTILSLCGIDGSNGYNGQHGGSSKPARILGGFKIGTFAK